MLIRGGITALAVGFGVAVALTGCGGDNSPDTATRCEQAFAEAADQPVNERRPNLLYDAAVACEDRGAWGRVARQHEDLLSGSTALKVLTEICHGEDPRLFDAGICAGL